MHLPSSPGATSDDKILRDTSCFIGKRVVVTEKMDGENTSLYRHGFHARSLDSCHRESQDWLAAWHGERQYSFPEHLRVCGEYLYAKHSLAYHQLPSYFLAFSVWDSEKCFSWDDTLTWLSLLDIQHVPVLYNGIFDEEVVDSIIKSLDTTRQEGIVVRNADEFLYDDFSSNVAKWVREGHVTTDKHWSKQPLQKNGIVRAC